MGWFSSDYEYNAYAASSPLFPEDERPETVKQLILQSALGDTGVFNGPQSRDAIIMGLNTNLYARAKSMFKYATKTNGQAYVRGVPETSHNSIYINAQDVWDKIESDIGEPIVGRDARSGRMPEIYLLWQSLDGSYMDPAYFNWPDGDPLDTNWENNLSEVEIPVTNPDTGLYYLANNTFTWTSVGGIYTVEFSYVDNLGADQIYTVESTYDLNGYDDAQWIRARYYTVANPGETQYFIYEIDSGDDPDFEAKIDQSSLQMEYLPVAVLMRDKIWFDDDDPADDDLLETTTDRLLRDMALDPYEIKEDYLEQKAEDDEAGEGGNAETWDFFIQFAVPVHTIVRGSREYIWYWLQFIQNIATWTSYDEYQAYLAGGQTGDQPSSNMHIEEGDTNSYHAFYKWSYIHTTTVDGQYTPPDWAEPLRARRLHSRIVKFGDADYQSGIDMVHGAGTPIATAEGELESHDYMVFTMQHQDYETGEYTHTHVLMMAPGMMYVINTQDDPALDARERYVAVELFPDDPEVDSEFRFPIHYQSLRDTATMHREEMLGEAACATVFLVEEVKVKWYQQTFFKWLIIIIAVIVIVITWRYELLPTLWAMAGAATGVAAIGLYALYAIMVFAIGFLISFAGQLIGGNLGILFVLVASMMVAGTNNIFMNLSSSWKTLAMSPAWGSAFSFIQAVYPYVSAGMAFYADYSTGQLQDKMDDFLKTARDRYDELQDAWDEVGKLPGWLDPLDLARSIANNNPNETPDMFRQRTLTTNPGVLGYELIAHFTDIALMLPEPGQESIIDNEIRTFETQRGIM